MLELRRLKTGEGALAQEMFATMAAVFEEEPSSEAEPLGVGDAEALLRREDFWAIVAVDDGAVVGGLTAHVLPMTRSRSRELFIYDLAVVPDRQRRGVGRALVAELLSLARTAGIETAFVPADDEDTHALAFYRSVGGDESPVTFFTFSSGAKGAGG